MEVDMPMLGFQLDSFRAMVMKIRDDAEHKRKAHVAAIVAAANDRWDVGDVLESSQRESGLVVSAAEAEVASLTGVLADQALKRMDKGVFGICIDCRQDIALLRLIAQPLAARCIRCQGELEKV